MKKFALALAVVFSVALVSCGNKNAEAVDSDTIVEAAVEEVVATDSDSNAVDTTTVAAAEVAEVPAEAAK